MVNVRSLLVNLFTFMMPLQNNLKYSYDLNLTVKMCTFDHLHWKLFNYYILPKQNRWQAFTGSDDEGSHTLFVM